MNAAERLKAANLLKSAWTAGGVANTVTDYMPFIGGAKDVGRGIGGMMGGGMDILRGNFRQGLGKYGAGLGQMTMGTGMLALDTFTGGLGGAAGKLALKGGGKALAQAGGKAFVRAAPWTAGAGLAGAGLTRLTEGPEQPQMPNIPGAQAAPQEMAGIGPNYRPAQAGPPPMHKQLYQPNLYPRGPQPSNPWWAPSQRNVMS